MIFKKIAPFLRLLAALTWMTAVDAFSSSSSDIARTTPFSRLRFDPDGVCTSPQYFRDNKSGCRYTLRNVPGDGDCMFLAVTLATMLSMGLETSDIHDIASLESIAKDTRKAVSRVFQSPGSLVIQGGKPPVPAKKLLASAVAQEQMSTADYLEKLETIGRLGGMYGGGPELVVLSNILRRPISIYEFPESFQYSLEDETDEYSIECKGTFGSFNDLLPEDSAVGIPFSWHLHVLVVDVSPNEKHACVLLPAQNNR